jgi:hypothetical protein
MRRSAVHGVARHAAIAEPAIKARFADMGATVLGFAL